MFKVQVLYSVKGQFWLGTRVIFRERIRKQGDKRTASALQPCASAVPVYEGRKSVTVKQIHILALLVYSTVHSHVKRKSISPVNREMPLPLSSNPYRRKVAGEFHLCCIRGILGSCLSLLHSSYLSGNA